MGVLALLAVQLGRRGQRLNTLAFAPALMALGNPYVLWGVGFQLSFTATLGLVLYAKPLDEWFRTAAGRYLPDNAVRNLAGPGGEFLLFTPAAQLVVLPNTIYHFQQIPLISVIANPLVLPA
jgi:competence protein ComEC